MYAGRAAGHATCSTGGGDCALHDGTAERHATRSNGGGLLVEVMLYMLEGWNGTRRVPEAMEGMRHVQMVVDGMPCVL